MATNGSLIFSPGQTSRTVIVTVLGDEAVEGNETMFLSVTSATNTMLVLAEVSGTILDDDTPPAPEIAVEQPSGTGLSDGLSSVDFGSTQLGGRTEQTFTIRNTGNTDLADLLISLSGPNSIDYQVTSNLPAALAAGDIAQFTVAFVPSAVGARTATLQVWSNDSDENPFDIALTGIGAVSPTSVQVVTSVNDSGPGSLREAILMANAAANTTRITFAIPGPAPFSIRPLSVLPQIVWPVVIDATTQPGFAGKPIIELRGDATEADVNGLSIASNGGGTTIRGLVINRFKYDGIWAHGGSNIIQGNYIGTDLPGTTSLGNGGGISVLGAGNRIGGTNVGEGNVISGNAGNGLWISTAWNQIQGNIIGLNAAGTAKLGNLYFGLWFLSSATNNVAGGITSGARNVISGNGQDGVAMTTGGGNRLEGNFIGLNAAGTAALGNAFSGVNIYAGSVSNIIGGTLPGAGNVISGNAQQGIYIWHTGQNTVQGNVVGLNASGTAKVPNGQFGIALVNSSSNSVGGTVAGARNVISGNTFSGVIIQDASWRNSVEGNFIGLNAAGTANLGNGQDGIVVSNAGTNTLGGTQVEAGNVISGNGLHGIEIAGSGAQSNLIQGNLIGTDCTGTKSVGNQQAGIYFSAAPNNLAGGATNTARNVISGNGYGVSASGSGASGNRIQGNYIGVDISGQRTLGNSQFGVVFLDAPNNTVGGTSAAMRNIISGNGLSGVLIENPGAAVNRVLGNFIGTDSSGQVALGNGEDGIFITGGVNNIIGGTTPGAGNVLSGNGLSGMEIWNRASGNLVQGNWIGTDVTGAGALGNSKHGIHCQNSSRNTVGGIVTAAGNVIAFNQLDGVFVESGTNNLVRANSIFANSGLGIDLGANGVTANDAGDADAGANNLQNYPVLTSALANLDGTTTVSGSFLSRANASFTLEFFVNLACDASGNGEGQQPIGLTNVTTAANGSNFFTVTVTNTIPAGRFITATATEGTMNTSEFSACVQVAPTAPPPPYLSSVMLLGNGAVQFAFTNVSAASFTVLASTNVSLPASNWIVLGSLMPIGGGIHQFTDLDATNHPTRYYQLRWP